MYVYTGMYICNKNLYNEDPLKVQWPKNDQLDIINNWSFNNVTLQYYVCLTPVTSLSVEHLFNTPPYPLGVQLEGEKTYVKNHKTVFCRFFTLVCFFRQASCESRFWEVPQEPLSVVQRAESEFLDPPLFGVVYFKWVFSLPYLWGGVCPISFRIVYCYTISP